MGITMIKQIQCVIVVETLVLDNNTNSGEVAMQQRVSNDPDEIIAWANSVKRSNGKNSKDETSVSEP